MTLLRALNLELLFHSKSHFFNDQLHSTASDLIIVNTSCRCVHTFPSHITTAVLLPFICSSQQSRSVCLHLCEALKKRLQPVLTLFTLFVLKICSRDSACLYPSELQKLMFWNELCINVRSNKKNELHVFDTFNLLQT